MDLREFLFPGRLFFCRGSLTQSTHEPDIGEADLRAGYGLRDGRGCGTRGNRGDCRTRANRAICGSRTFRYRLE